MSKVEKALWKARQIEEAGGQARTEAAGLEPGQELILRTTELQPYRHDIGRMVEPWRLSESDLAESKIVSPDMDDVAVADAFRALRTRIVQESNGSNCSVLVTSICGGGGASFVALNLAVAFTFDASRTALLVDCDLRRPAYDYLAAPMMQCGLTDYLESHDLDPGLIIHPAGIPRLRLIPAGRRSEVAPEHLESQRMRELLGSVKQRYDDRYVIVNTPSLTQTAEARVLSALVDFVVLVVPYAGATEAQVWHAAQLIDEAKFLGVVFNDEPRLPGFAWG